MFLSIIFCTYSFNSYTHRLTGMLLTAFTFTFSPSQVFSSFYRIFNFYIFSSDSLIKPQSPSLSFIARSNHQDIISKKRCLHFIILAQSPSVLSWVLKVIRYVSLPLYLISNIAVSPEEIVVSTAYKYYI